MNKNYLIIFFVGFLIISSVVLINKISAQGLDNIQYPVEELGGCQSESDCRAYCDNSDNADWCLDFAKKNNLMSEQEITVARKFLKGEIKGPGGCKNKDSCEEYCNDISRIEECVSFAEENNLIPPEELAEAKKVQAAIARGVKPPPCGNKKSCDVYCDGPEHMEECITFGLEAGFIQGKEAEDVQKMLQAVKRGVKPPPCRGKEACDQYCSAPENMEVCINFAIEAGFMSEQEKADSQKMLQAIKKGVKPPNCKGRQECDDYCGQDNHFEECTNFAVAAGFMDEKDAEMARKTGGKGPGGCKGKEGCEAFCNNPGNQETCFNFAKDNGMIPEEDIKKMEEGKQQMKQSFEQMPQEVSNCLQAEIGSDMVEKMKRGVMPSREMGDKMKECFKKMGPPSGKENRNFKPGTGTVNPGNQIMPEQSGPGGCKGPEECQKYCENNPEACKNFGQGRPNQMPPCEGDNCKYGPEREGSNYPDYRLPEGQNYRLPEGQIPPEGFRPPGDAGRLQPSEGFQPQEGRIESQQQPPPGESPPPPPPPPPGAFLKPESFLGSVLYVIAKALYSL